MMALRRCGGFFFFRRLIIIALVVAVVVPSGASRIPELENTCWDNDPSTPCPVSREANARYLELSMSGGAQPSIPLDRACRDAERIPANASQCMEALRKRMVLDEAESALVECHNRTAALFHTWWDGPLVRVVALFLRSFRKTQNNCAKLVVWTPRRGSERSTREAQRLVEDVEAMRGAPVVFEELDVREMARDTLFEDFVRRTILTQDWETETPKDKKEGTSHFSDFFQLFVLWRYGGVYFDADMILLRDFYPLWGLDFEYQWSFIPEKLNNAVQGLTKGHGEKLIIHGAKLRGTQCCKGWGATLWRAKVVQASGTYALPCSAFDPYWLRMDGHITGEAKKPSLPYPPHSDRSWLFQSNYDDSKDWYKGAFAIHWHGGAGGPRGGDGDVWKPDFAPTSYATYWEQHLFRDSD